MLEIMLGMLKVPGVIWLYNMSVSIHINKYLICYLTGTNHCFLAFQFLVPNLPGPPS